MKNNFSKILVGWSIILALVLAANAGGPLNVAQAASEPGGSGDGLRGEYFASQNLTSSSLIRTDATVSFVWGPGLPDPLLGADHFSIRWTGLVQPLYSEEYTFFVEANDGVRLWVNNQLIIEQWADQTTAHKWSGKVNLVAGVLYDLKLEYYENTGDASVKLSWASTRQAEQVIPQSQLYTTHPKRTDPKDLYVAYEENFYNLANWNPPYNITASFPTTGTVQLTLTGAYTSTWGKIERAPQAYIPVDLYRFPILRIKVLGVSNGAKWKLYLYKTSPVWQEFELQSITNATGVYDYNVPMITGWNGNQKLQVILCVEGTSGASASFDFIQLGSYPPPASPGAPAFTLFAKVAAMLTASPANTYTFVGTGSKVYEDNRSEPYTWTTYSWNFGDGTTGSGQTVTHTYSTAGFYRAILTAIDGQGNTEYAVKDVGTTKSLYADYFVGYHSREYSGRSDLWWWYLTEKAPWSARPGDLYEPGSTSKKQTIAFYNPLVGYYDQGDPAAMEYAILLSKMIGLDGFAFEYQDNTSPAASLMAKFLPYAQKYDFKMTAQWIPSTMYDWNKDKVNTRTQMLNMGQDVLKNVIQNYVLPSGATFRSGGVDRPVWFLFSWDRNQSLPDDSLPYTQTFNFGYTQDEISQLRSYATSQAGGVNPIFLAAAWSYWPEKWDAASGEAFPLAGVVDGMYGWPKPDFTPLTQTNPFSATYYQNHSYLGPNIDYIGTVAQNLNYFDKEYAESARLKSTGEFAVTSGTAFPGFDDSYNGAWGIGRRRYVPWQDANGYTIDQTLSRFTSNNPDIGLFATYADWAEGTTLEPTQEMGYDTAIRVAKGVAAWKGLPAPSDEFLNDYLPFVVDVYNLRQAYNFLKRAGYNDTELKAFKQAIDDIIPPLLAQDLSTAQARRQAAQMIDHTLLSGLAQRDLTLEWANEAQGASPSAGTLPLVMTATGSSQAFSFPDPVRALLNSGAYTGTLTFEYQDNSTAFLSAQVNTLAAFSTGMNQSTEILKVQKGNSGQWRSARADFVNASFSSRFSDRPDMTFQVQGAMAYVNSFTHTANALTVAYWVKEEALTNGLQNQILILNPESGAETFVSRVNNAYNGGSTPGLLEAYVNLDSRPQAITVTNALTAGNWVHVTVRWDGVAHQLQVYLNGILKATSTIGSGTLVNTAQQILVGTVSQGLDGAVDDLQVYNRVLASTEISTVVSGGSVALGLEGYWKFNEGTGNAAADSAAGNHPAYLYNGAVWTTDVPFSTLNPCALKLVGDSTGAALRRVRLDLKTYRRTTVPDFVPTFVEDFSDLNDWTASSVFAITDGNVATVTVPLTPTDRRIFLPSVRASRPAGRATVMLPLTPTWGKMERTETGYLKIDLDQNPILRIKVTEATAMWKLVMFDAVTWQSKTIKFLGTETGTLDYDLKKITEWSGGPKTFQLQIIVDGGSNGGGRYVTFDDLEIGRYTALPDPTYGFVDDFSSGGDWTASQAALITDGQKLTLTVADGQTWGKLERLDPAALITIDLDTHPILSTTITAVTGSWRLFVLDVNAGWKSYELQASTNQTGSLSYDLPALTGMSGTRTLQVQYIVEGAGTALTIDDLRFQRPVHPADWSIGYQEDFGDLSDWKVTDLISSTTNGVATFSVAPGKRWGKAERPEFGRLIWVDLDRYPILRLNAPEVTGTWKVMLYNAATWEEKLVKPMSDEKGVLDFNIKDITGWSGVEVPLQVSIILDSVEGHYANASLKLDDLQFRRDGNPLPVGVFLQEDFADVSDWTTENISLTTASGVATGAIVSGSYGQLYRNVPGRLFNVNLDDYPILRLNVTEATGLWKVVLYNVTNNWEEKYIKYLTDETAELDLNIKDITGWSGKDVQLQMVIYVDGGAGKYVKFDTLQFRRIGHALPAEVGFDEDFSDVSDWTTSTAQLSTTNGVAQLRAFGQSYGKMERLNPSRLVTVDLDKFPILRVTAPSISTDGLWKIVLFNASNWNLPAQTIKYLTNETGELDYNIKDLTGWSGVVPMHIAIYVDGGDGKYVLLDDLQFRRYGHALPPDVRFDEDFNDVNDWVTFQSTLTSDHVPPYIATMTIGSEGWGKIERTNRGGLITVDLNVYPYLKIKVPSATGHWKVTLLSTANWNDVKTIQDFTTTPGVYYYNVKALTGWSGETCMLMQIYVDGGPGKTVALDSAQFRKEAGSVLNFTVPYTSSLQSNSSGAASLKMTLDYEGHNAYSQTVLYDYAHSQNLPANAGSDILDPQGMVSALNRYELDQNYNYAALSSTSLAQAYYNLSYWLAYRVPSANPENMPAIIPLGGSYANWVVVNGFRAGDDPLTASSYTVNGFWITDPTVTGIGQNVYLQAAVLSDSYKPLNTSDTWNGKYVSVSEPPPQPVTVTVAAPVSFKDHLASKQDIVASARHVLEEGDLKAEANFQAAYTGTRLGNLVLAQRANGNYFIVPFVKQGGCTVAVIVNAQNGAFLQAAYSLQPDAHYLNRLRSARSSLKASDALRAATRSAQTTSALNAFLPDLEQTILIDD